MGTQQVYFRCSTQRQEYLQQQECVFGYLKRMGLDPSALPVTEEHISGTVKHTERKLYGLLMRCGHGDTIYVSELSRLGRNMSDLFQIVTTASDKGIRIIQCKDGSVIENESIGGKALLFALSLAAEIEVANIRQRTNMGLQARKEMLEKDGFFVSKSGKVCTKFGREKGCDTSAASAASAESKKIAAREWKEKSAGYQWVKRQLQKGTLSRKEIIEEFNEMHDAGVAGFSTSSGSALSAAILSKWASEILANA